MNTKLEENLPIAFKRKPIYNTKQEKKLLNDTASSSDQSSTSTLKNEEEEVLENSTNAEVKVIRYLNPHKFYVTQDGYTFPISSEQSLAPFHLVNLSNRVEKIQVDRATGALSYVLSPKFDSSDIVPWEFIIQKMKFGGYSEYHDLMIAFEGLMQAREEFIKYRREHPPSEYNIFDQLEEYKPSDTVPQIAEMRASSQSGLPNFPISQCIINKPMQQLVGIKSETEVLSSLHLGVKSLRFLSKTDSMRCLQKYFENYASLLKENFKKRGNDESVRFTRLAADGTVLELDVNVKMMRYSGKAVFVYSYQIVDKKENKNALDGLSSDSKRTTPMKNAKLENNIYNGEEMQILTKERHNALEFLKRFNYPCKLLYVEPPKDRVCRIKELNSIKIESDFS